LIFAAISGTAGDELAAGEAHPMPLSSPAGARRRSLRD